MLRTGIYDTEDTWAQNDKHVPSLEGSSFKF